MWLSHTVWSHTLYWAGWILNSGCLSRVLNKSMIKQYSIEVTTLFVVIKIKHQILPFN